MSGIAAKTAMRSTLRSMEERAISDVYDRTPIPRKRTAARSKTDYRPAFLAVVIAGFALIAAFAFLMM